MGGRNYGESPLHIAYARESFNAPTYLIPVGTVYLHPGPNGQNTVIRWTAPESGPYRIQGWMNGSTFSYQSTIDVAVLHGITEILTADISGFYVGLMFDVIEQITAGDTIDFTVGYGTDGNYDGDATAIAVTIVPLTGETGDLNSDGCVDRADLALLMDQIRARSSNLVYDVNGDGKVDIADARFLALHFTNPAGAPCD